MNCLSTAVSDIRPRRKRFSISGSLLLLPLLVLLLVTQTSCRPSTPDDETAKHNNGNNNNNNNNNNDDEGVVDIAFDAGDEYADVDNVEWHHVKIVDGIMHEDHPIIMYKEDFVSEDYDPNKYGSKSSNSDESTAQRRYKHLQRQQSRLNRTQTNEQYHALEPEKIYFDVLPQTPVVVSDDSGSNDSKFDSTSIHVDVISLLDGEDKEAADEANKAQLSASIEKEEDESTSSSSKELLNKRPKKYHRRLRRETAAAITNAETQEQAAQHVLHKRNPRYTYERVGSNSFDDYENHWRNHYAPRPAVAVAGKRWNGIDGVVPPAEPLMPLIPIMSFSNRFGGTDNEDRVIWGSRKSPKNDRPQSATRPAQPPQSQKPTFPPLFHNSNPNDADFSAFKPQRPAQSSPAQQPAFPPLFHNSNPNDADFSAFTQAPPKRRPQTNAPPSNRSPQADPIPPSVDTNQISSGGEASISQCVWAIVNCCSSSNQNIRYDCFERLGCRGAFWNLNPCADNVKDTVLDYVDQQFN